jgi:hypothetical protein
MSIRDKHWVDIFEGERTEGKPKAADIDSAIALSIGTNGQSDICLVQNKGSFAGGRFTFLERKFRNGRPFSESVVTGTRNQCELAMGSQTKKRLKL